MVSGPGGGLDDSDRSKYPPRSGKGSSKVMLKGEKYK